VLTALTALALLAAAIAVVELKLRPKWLMESFLGWLCWRQWRCRRAGASLRLQGSEPGPEHHRRAVVEERSSPLGQITVWKTTACRCAMRRDEPQRHE